MTATSLHFQVPKAIWQTANGRTHWRERARRTAALREQAVLYTRARGKRRYSVPVDVTATISYPTARRADPANAAPTVKAILDGIVDAGLLADDDHRHVPAVTYRRGDDTKTPGLYVVRIDLEPSA